MKERQVTGMLVNVEQNFAKIVTVPDELPEYYNLLNCQYIDIYRRKVGDRWYTVVCDDEGALKVDAIVSGVDTQGRIAFYGNLLILSGRADDAELHSLTDSEIDNLIPNISTHVKDHDGNTIKKTMVFHIGYN